MGRGDPRFERGGCAQASKAGFPEEVAKVSGRRRSGPKRARGSELAEVDATQRFPGLAEEVGGRAHLRLDLSQSQDELRDYERLCATGEAFV
jgi:hypothetical protein